MQPWPTTPAVAHHHWHQQCLEIICSTLLYTPPATTRLSKPSKRLLSIPLYCDYHIEHYNHSNSCIDSWWHLLYNV